MSIGRNANWTLNKQVDGTFRTEQAQLGVLMDIRDELSKLNTLLGCQNFRNIPRKLDRISANTHKRKKAKPILLKGDKQNGKKSI